MLPVNLLREKEAYWKAEAESPQSYNVYSPPPASLVTLSSAGIHTEKTTL